MLSANRDAYSETFIVAQREHLPHNIFFYYHGLPPRKIANGAAMRPTFFQRMLAKVTRSNDSLHTTNLKRSFRNNHIDVVLAQFGPMGVAIAQICADLELPLIVHFHGADAYVMDHISPIEKYKSMFDIADAIIVVSDDMKRQLLRLGAPETKLYLTCYGPRQEFFKINAPRNHKRFLSVGRFVDKKAPYYTILAFSRIIAAHGEARLTMVGDGPLLNTCKNLVKYLKLETNVDFKGVLSHDEVCEIMQESLCFVQHSITADNGDKEGSPVAIIEAAAAGLPIVATKHAGINFTVVHNQTGYLVDEGDVEGMSQYMNRICSDFSKAIAFGDAGRRHISQNASMDKYISDIHIVILKVYDAKKSKGKYNINQ